MQQDSSNVAASKSGTGQSQGGGKGGAASAVLRSSKANDPSSWAGAVWERCKKKKDGNTAIWCVVAIRCLPSTDGSRHLKRVCGLVRQTTPDTVRFASLFGSGIRFDSSLNFFLLAKGDDI